MAINTLKFIEGCLKIKNKNAELVELKLNPPQMKFYQAIQEQAKKGKPIRIIILKARQMGFSTLTEGIIFKKTCTAPLVSSGIVAHEISATDNLFNMSKRYHEYLPDDIRGHIPLKKSNAKEVIFDFADGDSVIKCMTAGNMSIGRSDTFQNLHVSEYAFWKGDKEQTLSGLMQAVPNLKNTMVVIESTANGYEDFKERWDKAVAGESEFIPIFCAWWELPEYTMPYDGFALTEEEKTLQDRYNLTLDQLTWRRWCIKNNCNSNVDTFKQEYPSNPDEAFLMSGRPVFNNEKIIDRIAQLEQIYKERPYKEGYFSFEYDEKTRIDKNSIVFVESKQKNFIRLYQEPIEGFPYVIGGDTKGEGNDFFAGTVKNNVTGKRVATLHMDISESKPYTHQMYCLGVYFNMALIAIEINFNTAPIEELQRLNYPKQYVRRKYDDFMKRTEEKFGWRTDGVTRPLIIDKEIDLINNNIELFTDIPTLRECMTFVYDDKGRPDAISGKHDDLLMSDMIASECSGQQTYKTAAELDRVVRVTESMYLDYQKANSRDKRLLEDLWGGKPAKMLS